MLFHTYERNGAALLGLRKFAVRVVISCLIALGITLVSLGIGTLGYGYLAPCIWLDALHNAAMILAGMGPVIEIKTGAGKLFSTIYALYCGIVYLAVMGILMAPFYHRMLHHFHLERGTCENT